MIRKFWDTKYEIQKSMFRKIQHIHLVGIGGSGMSGIAEVLLSRTQELAAQKKKRARPDPHVWDADSEFNDVWLQWTITSIN